MSEQAHIYRVRRWVNRLAQVIWLATNQRPDDTWFRAGDCICQVCGETYSRHAHDPFEPWLTVLCQTSGQPGQRVKL